MNPKQFKQLNIEDLAKLAQTKPEVIADVYAFGYNAGWKHGTEQRDQAYNRRKVMTKPLEIILQDTESGYNAELRRGNLAISLRNYPKTPEGEKRGEEFCYEINRILSPRRRFVSRSRKVNYENNSQQGASRNTVTGKERQCYSTY